MNHINFGLVEKVAQEIRDLTTSAGGTQTLIHALTADHAVELGQLDKLEEQLYALVVGPQQIEPAAAVPGVPAPGSTWPNGFRGRLTWDHTVHDVYPVAVGTSITTHHIAMMVRDGALWRDILRWYPELSEDGIRAALEYSSQIEPAR
jgi:hypothetical protein